MSSINVRNHYFGEHSLRIHITPIYPPNAMRHSTISVWPLDAARCNAVNPSYHKNNYIRSLDFNTRIRNNGKSRTDQPALFNKIRYNGGEIIP